MATRNHSEAVADKSKRQLTAKGNKFLWRCIDIVANSKGSNRYAPEMKEVKDGLESLIKYLLIDKGHTIKEVVEIIKQSEYLGLQNADLTLN